MNNMSTRRKKRRAFRDFSFAMAAIVVVTTTICIINVQANEFQTDTKILDARTKLENEFKTVKETELETETETEAETEIKTMAETETEIETVSETEVETEDVFQTEYLGEFCITAYCACSACCGPNAQGITASGKYVEPYYTIAVDPSVIPLGTLVMIDGNIYEAQDTGNGVWGNHIDIYMESHSDALNFGERYESVYIVV